MSLRHNTLASLFPIQVFDLLQFLSHHVLCPRAFLFLMYIKSPNPCTLERFMLHVSDPALSFPHIRLWSVPKQWRNTVTSFISHGFPNTNTICVCERLFNLRPFPSFDNYLLEVCLYDAIWITWRFSLILWSVICRVHLKARSLQSVKCITMVVCISSLSISHKFQFNLLYMPKDKGWIGGKQNNVNILTHLLILINENSDSNGSIRIT